MPVNRKEIMDLLSHLAEEEDLRVTVTESAKAALIAAASTAAGGLLLGRKGVAIFGILGGCAAALVSKDFSSVPEVLSRMSPEKQESLAHNVRKIMADVNVTDIAPFAALIAGDTTVRSRVISELIDYLRTEMSMAVADH